MPEDTIIEIFVNGEAVNIKAIEKPPIGLRPKYIADEQRHNEVKEAIHRYINNNRPIPAEWIEEYNSFLKK